MIQKGREKRGDKIGGVKKKRKWERSSGKKDVIRILIATARAVRTKKGKKGRGEKRGGAKGEGASKHGQLSAWDKHKDKTPRKKKGTRSRKSVGGVGIKEVPDNLPCRTNWKN